VIAITLALELAAAEVHAIDLSTDALALAAANAERHGLTGRITFHQTDLLPPGDSKFELIVANLPYIPVAEIAALSPEVRHDPLAALDGGPDGLDLIRRLIEAAPERLTPGGALLLEIGAGQADAVNTLLANRKFRDISVRSDYQNIPRFAVGFHG
jgi:release factor glutamine methyltransferase